MVSRKTRARWLVPVLIALLLLGGFLFVAHKEEQARTDFTSGDEKSGAPPENLGTEDSCADDRARFRVGLRVVDAYGETVAAARVCLVSKDLGSADVAIWDNAETRYCVEVPAGSYSCLVDSCQWGELEQDIVVSYSRGFLLRYCGRSKIKVKSLVDCTIVELGLSGRCSPVQGPVLPKRTFPGGKVARAGVELFEFSDVGVGSFRVEGRTERSAFSKAVEVEENGSEVVVKICPEDFGDLPPFDDLVYFVVRRVDSAGGSVLMPYVKVEYRIQYAYGLVSSGSAISDDAGLMELRLRRVLPDTIFTFRSMGYRDVSVRWTREGPAGRLEPPAIEFLSRTPERAIRLVDEFGSAMPGLEVVVRRVSPERGESITLQSDLDGVVDVGVLSEGTYRLLVEVWDAGRDLGPELTVLRETVVVSDRPAVQELQLPVGPTLCIVTNHAAPGSAWIECEVGHTLTCVPVLGRVTTVTNLRSEGRCFVVLVAYSSQDVLVGNGEFVFDAGQDSIGIPLDPAPQRLLRLIDEEGDDVESIDGVSWEIEATFDDVGVADWGKVVSSLDIVRQIGGPGMFRVVDIPCFRGSFCVWRGGIAGELAYPLGKNGPAVLARCEQLRGVVRDVDGGKGVSEAYVQLVYAGGTVGTCVTGRSGEFVFVPGDERPESLNCSKGGYQSEIVNAPVAGEHYEVLMERE